MITTSAPLNIKVIMARFSITLPDSLHESLSTLAEKKQISLSQTIRELIESGLEIERLTQEATGGTGENNERPFSPEKEKMLWKHLLASSFESRMLIRGLFEKILESKLDNVLGEVQKIKEKAESRAAGLLELNED